MSNKPFGWITSESIYRLTRIGGNRKGTVPVHKKRSSVAKTPLYMAPTALTEEDVRKAGGIVHRDGNIFFTNIEHLNAAILKTGGVTQ